MKDSLLYPQNTCSRREVSLDGMWRFSFDPSSAGLDEGWACGLPEAVSIPVPSSFADLFTDKESREYCGDFWYETDFFVPGEWAGKEIVVRFGSATHRARVFVNGKEVASHVGGFLPFNAVVTDAVVLNRMNHLALLMNNELSQVMIPCGTTTVLSDGRKMAAPYFDFFNYSGIHRPVKLMALPKEAVTDYETVFRLGEGGTAFVDYTVTTNGPHPVRVELLDASGKTAAVSEGKSGTLTVENARLWEVRNAYLYTLLIRIMDDGKSIDEYCDKIGIRTFEISGGKFLLNGKPVYLKGFGRHEDADIRGRGLDLPTLKRDFELMKWIGANSFRTSHYPYAEEVYYMADEEGFLVIDEVPAVGMFESLLNAVDASGGGKDKPRWFEKETTPELLAHHKDCIREMIRRDKNHPSVIAWSLLNEPETTYEAAAAYFEQVFSLARGLDPQKRPRTFAVIGNSLPELCCCQHLCDFIALNRYYGWYSMGGFLINEAERAFRHEMDGWAKVLDGRPLIFTEFGADTNQQLHKLPSVMWSQEYQDEYLSMCFKVFDSYDFVQGEQVWNFADFQTGEGIIRMNGNKKGIFSRDRQPKDAAYVFRKRWTEA